MSLREKINDYAGKIPYISDALTAEVNIKNMAKAMKYIGSSVRGLYQRENLKDFADEIGKFPEKIFYDFPFSRLCLTTDENGNLRVYHAEHNSSASRDLEKYCIKS